MADADRDGPVFSALRVYALTGQSKVLALITLFFGLGPLYANAVSIVTIFCTLFAGDLHFLPNWNRSITDGKSRSTSAQTSAAQL